MRPIENGAHIFLCDRFFDDRRTEHKDAHCHVMDRGSLMIQGMSMLPEFGLKQNLRVNGHGDIFPSFKDVIKLNSEDSFNNAQVYGYFAQGTL